jgi:cell division transport system permease protein
MASFVAISHGLTGWRTDLASRLTVQIPARPRDSLTKRVDDALELLRTQPEVASVRPLSEAEEEALLEPWLGKGAALASLPIPKLIDVTVAAGAALDRAVLSDGLAQASPGAILDDNQEWVAEIARIATIVQAVALGVITLVSLAGVAIVIFATRAGLSVHHENVEILHLMGAQDVFIAREFQSRYFRLGLLGGLLGLAMAAICLLGAFQIVSKTGGPWLPRLVPDADTMLVLAPLPLVAGILAMITARLTVLRALRRMM